MPNNRRIFKFFVVQAQCLQKVFFRDKVQRIQVTDKEFTCHMAEIERVESKCFPLGPVKVDEEGGGFLSEKRCFRVLDLLEKRSNRI